MSQGSETERKRAAVFLLTLLVGNRNWNSSNTWLKDYEITKMGLEKVLWGGLLLYTRVHDLLQHFLIFISVLEDDVIHIHSLIKWEYSCHYQVWKFPRRIKAGWCSFWYFQTTFLTLVIKEGKIIKYDVWTKKRGGGSALSRFVSLFCVRKETA